jgi:hypothetical protein
MVLRGVLLELLNFVFTQPDNTHWTGKYHRASSASFSISSFEKEIFFLLEYNLEDHWHRINSYRENLLVSFELNRRLMFED